ncbi:hypothetical protein I7I53_00958 [Histoplasma capsulatum var. duboisii H88]|uniref:Uncharacterized protein n=1 Tax=Ajellomyces capsulatus (strain H88) TaxID=544711 RepID=A0A8A1LNS1_AJEC8|nr:hypothetical protein I7I53_00958 [Histoplasma capsulatum var. duboisii H88]
MDKTFPDQSSRQYFQGLGILDISTAIGPTRHVLVVRPVGGYIKDQNDKQGSPIFSFGRQTNIDHLGDKARSSASETPAGMPPQPPVVPVPPEKNKIRNSHYHPNDWCCRLLAGSVLNKMRFSAIALSFSLF